MGAKRRLCLLPISRVHLENSLWLNSVISIHPSRSLSPEMFHVVGWPEHDYQEHIRRNSFADVNGTLNVSASGSDLPWFKSASTRIDLPNFFGSALIALPIELDWSVFLSPPSHEMHLEILGAAMAQAEDILDLVRFEMCNLWTPQTLPGRAGLLEETTFCAGLFYTPEDDESYIIGGEIATHQIISGIGLDLSNANMMPEIGQGEIGSIVRHGLRLLSDAMAAATETSRFVQMLFLLEFLAAPDEFLKMDKVKRIIARHVARDRKEYEEILQYFMFLTSDNRGSGGENKGLRHNIIHRGRRIEDIVSPEERVKIFKRMFRYSGAILEQMILNSGGGWEKIEDIRSRAGVKLGLLPDEKA